MRSQPKNVESPVLPDGLVIGPQKAGTTWIHRYLESIESVCLPRQIKETFFFDRRYYKGAKWYEAHFKHCERGLRTVEVAPTYFSNVEATERIHRHLGAIPLVCTLREPVKRTFSLYLHMLRYGMIRCDFRTAVRKRPELIDSSRYATHLRRWMNRFGSENVKVLFLQTLIEEPGTYVSQLCEHLRIPRVEINDSLMRPVNEAALPYSSYLAFIGNHLADALRSFRLYGIIEFTKRVGLKRFFLGHSNARKLPELNADDYSWLKEKLMPEIEKLEELLHVDLSDWRNEGADG